MSPFALGTHLITIQRPTSFVLDSRSPASSMAVSRQPASACRVMVKLTGTPTGTVTVAGTVAGVADAEVLTWTGAAGARVTTKAFSALTGFTSSLSGGAAVQAQAVGAGGQPDANVLTSVLSGLPASVIRRNQPGWRAFDPGHEQEGDALVKLPYLDTYTPLVGDLVSTSVDAFEAISVELRGGDLRPSEWIVFLKLRKGRT